MRVLLTNDDGIDSEGLLSLYNFTRFSMGFTDIWIVAPSIDMSASSHSVSLNKPISVTPLGEKKFSVSGTPVDCVIVATARLMRDHPPDLIFSGINSGANIGRDTIYSGTVGAAMEGTFLGFPSFAFSKLYKLNKNEIIWETDYVMLNKLVNDLLSEKDVLLKNTININLPLGKFSNGIKFIKQNSYKTDNIVLCKDSDFVISMNCRPLLCDLLRADFITVNVVGCDLTDHDDLGYLNGKYSY